MTQSPTACAILIGNEILSGSTVDKNLSEFGLRLAACGIVLKEARVITDDEDVIAATVNECRAKYDYVFTTGGIGPTHDDITSASIAKAFGVPVIRHPEADTLLRDYYGPDKINDARMKMADVPQGATLIANPISVAPGFILENVYVLAGVPSIMRAMMDELKPLLKGGAPVESLAFDVMLAEGDIAAQLTNVQEAFPQVEIGVYPRIFDGALASHVVLRSADAASLASADQAAKAALGATHIRESSDA